MINIIGAGLSGLSAAVTLAQHNIPSRLISFEQSERAQSVMAEGGINASLNTMGENDTIEEHIKDTMAGGCDIADMDAVRGLCEGAPDVVKFFDKIGVPFPKNEKGIIQRNFGGQKKKRTAYVKSGTGKMLMTALIDEARKYESKGLINRYVGFMFKQLILDGEICKGVIVSDRYTFEEKVFEGTVIMATGGMAGLFFGKTTGSMHNTSDAAAMLLYQGVEFANLEFIQYHPTTIEISGKRLLISEAARGEGGRLFAYKNNEKWYFMEEKYPELKNLMPRDVVSAEINALKDVPECDGKAYLDMTEISENVWNERLSDLREECIHYLKIDPAKEPIPISPGIHYFMGGINVDNSHKTNFDGLYAAGECACIYHGANRLGGNSLLGAVYGGMVSARSAMEYESLLSNNTDANSSSELEMESSITGAEQYGDETRDKEAIEESLKNIERVENAGGFPTYSLTKVISDTLYESLPIIRNENQMTEAGKKLSSMLSKAKTGADTRRLLLAIATVKCALYRKETRGAHKRSDYPNRDDINFKNKTVIRYEADNFHIASK